LRKFSADFVLFIEFSGEFCGKRPKKLRKKFKFEIKVKFGKEKIY
jgi:hypothetical protein